MINSLSFKDFCVQAERSSTSLSLIIKGGKVCVFDPSGKKHKKEAQIHQKTWDVFLRSMAPLCSEDYIRSVFIRHNLDIDLVRRSPLSVKMVRLFSYALRIPSDLHSVEAAKKVEAELEGIEPVKKKSGNRWKEWGTFRVAPWILEKTLHNAAHTIRDGVDFEYFMERMTHVVSSCRLVEGMKFPAHCNGEWYRVAKTVRCQGLVASVFIPDSPASSLPSLVIFRPSQYTVSEGAFDTTLDDFQVEIGKRGYEAARGQLDALLHSTLRDRSVVLGGYSLGGVHAQHWAADHPTRFSEIYLFNSPGIPGQDADRFATVINSKIPQPLTHKVGIHIYRPYQESVAGKKLSSPLPDIVCHVGHKLLGSGVVHSDVDVKLARMYYDAPKKLSIGDRHRIHFFSSKTFPHHVEYVTGLSLQKELDNFQGDFAWCEFLRRTLGAKIVFPFIRRLRDISLWVCRKLDIDPFKYQPFQQIH